MVPQGQEISGQVFIAVTAGWLAGWLAFISISSCVTRGVTPVGMLSLALSFSFLLFPIAPSKTSILACVCTPVVAVGYLLALPCYLSQLPHFFLNHPLHTLLRFLLILFSCSCVSSYFFFQWSTSISNG